MYCAVVQQNTLQALQVVRHDNIRGEWDLIAVQFFLALCCVPYYNGRESKQCNCNTRYNCAVKH